MGWPLLCGTQDPQRFSPTMGHKDPENYDRGDLQANKCTSMCPSTLKGSNMHETQNPSILVQRHFLAADFLISILLSASTWPHLTFPVLGPLLGWHRLRGAALIFRRDVRKEPCPTSRVQEKNLQ